MQFRNFDQKVQLFRLIRIFTDFHLAISLCSGPSPPIKKWSGGGSHRVLKAREGESTRGGEHERGDYSPFRDGGGGLGGLPREKF